MAGVYRRVLVKGEDGKIRAERRTDSGPGTWFLDYPDHSGRRRREATTATTKTEALALLRSRRSDQAKAELAGVANPEALSMTLSRFVETVYLPQIRTTRRLGTVKNYEVYGKDLRSLGNKLLTQISREDVLEYQNLLIREKGTNERHLSRASVNRRLGFVRSALYDALARGYVGRNPAARLRPLPEENRRTRVLSPIEEGKLLKASPEWFRPIVRVALLSGLRLGEITRLRRSDIDWERNLLRVSAEAKNHKGRSVPITPDLVPILEAALPRIDPAGANPYVFPGPDGGPVPDHRVTDAFRYSAARAELRDVWFHDLRRTFATRLVDQNVGLPVVARLLGHGATYVTERYAHVSDGAAEEAVALLSAGQVGTNPAHTGGRRAAAGE